MCWPNWPGQQAEWFLAADTSYPGNPSTNYAPGIGYPTGWNPPNIVWPGPERNRAGGGGRAPITAFGIGAWGREEGTPAVATTWGRVKGLYR